MGKKSCNENSVDKLLDKIDRMSRKIKRLERQVKQLRSDNSTLNYAWAKTEEYLLNITEGKKHINRVRRKCSNCSSKTMDKIDFEGFYVIVCPKCGCRNRVNEESERKG